MRSAAEGLVMGYRTILVPMLGIATDSAHTRARIADMLFGAV